MNDDNVIDREQQKSSTSNVTPENVRLKVAPVKVTHTELIVDSAVKPSPPSPVKAVGKIQYVPYPGQQSNAASNTDETKEDSDITEPDNELSDIENDEASATKVEELKSRNVCVLLSLIPIAGISRMYLGYWKFGIIEFLLSIGLPIIAVLLMVVMNKVFGYDVSLDNINNDSPLFTLMILLPYVGWFWCYIESHVIKTDAKGRPIKPGSFWKRLKYAALGYLGLTIFSFIIMVCLVPLISENDGVDTTSCSFVLKLINVSLLILFTFMLMIFGGIGVHKANKDEFYLHKSVPDLLFSSFLTALFWFNFIAPIALEKKLAETGNELAIYVTFFVGAAVCILSIWLMVRQVKKCNAPLTKWQLFFATSGRLLIITGIQILCLGVIGSLAKLVKERDKVGGRAKIHPISFSNGNQKLMKTWGNTGKKLFPFICAATSCIILGKKLYVRILNTCEDEDISLSAFTYGVANLFTIMLAGFCYICIYGCINDYFPAAHRTAHTATAPIEQPCNAIAAQQKSETSNSYDFTPEGETMALDSAPQPVQQKEPEVASRTVTETRPTTEPSLTAKPKTEAVPSFVSTPQSTTWSATPPQTGKAEKVARLMHRAQEIKQSGVETLAAARSKGIDVSCSAEEINLLIDIINTPEFINQRDSSQVAEEETLLACLLVGLAAADDETICNIVFERMEKEARSFKPTTFRWLTQRLALANISNCNYRFLQLASAIIGQDEEKPILYRPELLSYIWSAIAYCMTPEHVEDIVNKLLKLDSQQQEAEILLEKQRAVAEFAHILSPIQFLSTRIIQQQDGGYLTIEKETNKELTVSAMIEVDFVADMQNYRSLTEILDQIFSEGAAVKMKFARAMMDIEEDTEDEQMCRAEGNIDKRLYPQVCTIDTSDMLEKMPAEDNLVFVGTPLGDKIHAYSLSTQSPAYVIYSLIKDICEENGRFPFEITLSLRDKEMQQRGIISLRDSEKEYIGQPVYSVISCNITEKEVLMIDPSFYGGSAVAYGISGNMFFGKSIMKVTGTLPAQYKNSLDSVTYFIEAPSFVLSAEKAHEYAQKLIQVHKAALTPTNKATSSVIPAPDTMAGKRIRFMYSDTRYREGEYDGETSTWNAWQTKDLSVNSDSVWVGRVAPVELLFPLTDRAISKPDPQESNYLLVCIYSPGNNTPATIQRELTVKANEAGEHSGEYVLTFDTPTSGTAAIKNCNFGETCFECENIRFVIEDLSEDEIEAATSAVEGSLSETEKAELEDFLETLVMTPAMASSTWKLYQFRLMTLLPMIQEGSPVDVTTVETKGNTALHYACGMGRIDIVEWLVNHGADVNKRTDKGATPLDCVSGGYNAAEIRRLLTQHGAVKGKKGKRR